MRLSMRFCIEQGCEEFRNRKTPASCPYGSRPKMPVRVCAITNKFPKAMRKCPLGKDCPEGC